MAITHEEAFRTPRRTMRTFPPPPGVDHHEFDIERFMETAAASANESAMRQNAMMSYLALFEETKVLDAEGKESVVLAKPLGRPMKTLSGVLKWSVRGNGSLSASFNPDNEAPASPDIGGIAVKLSHGRIVSISANSND